MKALGMKVLIIGLVVFLFSTILGLYVACYQFFQYVIKESASLEEVKTVITVALFGQIFSVIGVLIAIIGMSMLLKVPQEIELKPSA